jgi:cytidyltransferase-like protein
MNKKIVLVTGGFDPLHSGHIQYFKSARELGDKLIVGLNSDAWLERKKSRAFMPVWERDQIIRELKMVDMTVMVADDADGSCTTFIRETLALFPNDDIIFANGGDRTRDNIPEMSIQDARLSFVFGVGGENKANSSSWILQEWKAPKTERHWGYYRVLHEVEGTKVKELTVMPGKSLSLQRHKHRQEFWHVTEGQCNVEQRMPGGYALPTITLNKFSQLSIPQNDWHRIYNPFDTPCRIVEIQYGAQCTEEDIERQNS